MQPSWRTDSAGSTLSDLREVPDDETWQMLRKGGTAGVYVVVMGLSWWILAQSGNRDSDAWSIVDDLTWVLQQLNDGDRELAPSRQKRARDGEGKDVRPQKR